MCTSRTRIARQRDVAVPVPLDDEARPAPRCRRPTVTTPMPTLAVSRSSVTAAGAAREIPQSVGSDGRERPQSDECLSSGPAGGQADGAIDGDQPRRSRGSRASRAARSPAHDRRCARDVRVDRSRRRPRDPVRPVTPGAGRPLAGSRMWWSLGPAARPAANRCAGGGEGRPPRSAMVCPAAVDRRAVILGDADRPASGWRWARRLRCRRRC